MASIAQDGPQHEQPAGAADRFFFKLALMMALIIVAGFSMQLLMGRSTFAARPLVHLHALVFMGWVALFTAQSWLGTHGSLAIHRRLGWIAAAWVVLMLVMAFAITIDVTQRGSAPFFFRPQLFLIANPMTALAFGALVTAAIRNRRRTDWHQRLHMGAMAMLLGPAFGRLLPMPLMIPWSFEMCVAAGLFVPIIGAGRDRRTLGHVHPAWWWCFAAFAATFALFEAITWSPLGSTIYHAVTAGTPGALVDPMGFPPPPPMG